MKLLVPILISACAPMAPTQSADLARHGATPDMVLTGPNLGWAMEAGDFNGDGVRDLVATSDEAGVGEMHVWYGQPDATLLEGPVIAMPYTITRTPPGYVEDYYRPKVTSIDLQPDGFDDLLTAGRAWLGGANGFTPVAATYFGGSSNVGDLDGDGVDEFLGLVQETIPNIYDFSLLHLTEVTFDNGAFTSTTLETWGDYFCYPTLRYLRAVGDLNGDGYDDLSTGTLGDCQFRSSMGWYAGSPTTVLGPHQAGWTDQGTHYPSASFAPGGHADLNGDGHDDLIMLSRGGTGAARLFLSGADPAIPIPGPPSASAWADNGLLPGDLDGDGEPDLLIASEIDGRGVVHRLRTVGGVLQPLPDLYWQGETAGARLGVSMVSLGDMDGDGAVEVAIAEPGNNSVLILRGGPGEGCAAGDVPAMTYDDNDGDGQTSPWSPRATCAAPAEPAEGDCDDDDALVYPGASDPGAPTRDYDCDGIARCALDADGDTYGSSTIVDSPTFFCDGPGLSDNADDCDDAAYWTRPGAHDGAGDNIDANCDGILTCFLDTDGDGFLGTRYTAVAPSCSGAPANDCNDDAAAIHPGAVEVPVDGIDGDCDGREICFADHDGDTYGAGTLLSYSRACTSAPAAGRGGDCDDTNSGVYPGYPWDPPDGVDADCDGDDRPDLSIDVRPSGRLLVHLNNTNEWGPAALLVSRVGPGAGPCLRWMGGQCSALTRPSVVYTVFGPPSSITLTPPPGLSGTQVWFELWSGTSPYIASSTVVSVTLP